MENNTIENKIYEISELLIAASEWLNDPANEEKQAAWDEIKRSLVIREYMPLGQKEICIKKALIDMRTDEDITPHTASILYEIAIFFDCLLPYIVNLNPAIDSIFKEPYYYDVLVMAGLKDFIFSYCEKDYHSIEQLASRMIAFDNLKELSKNISLTSPEQIDNLTREFVRFTTQTDPEAIKALGNIASLNDPLLNTIKETIEDTAYKVALEAGND